MHYIHFGVVPVEHTPGLPTTPRVHDHDDPEREHLFTLISDYHGVPLHAMVTGSWACWGPADQETDGDHTLHVVLAVASLDDVDDIRQSLVWHTRGGRLLDHAVVTTEDWSHVTTLILFDSRGHYTYHLLSPVGRP